MMALLDPIVTKIRMMLARGVLALVDDARKMQAVQVKGMAGEALNDVEHPQPYGFTSNPLPGAEAFMMFPGGDRSHGIALVIDDRRYRLKPLGSGEVAIYSHEGHSVVLKNGRLVQVDCDDLVINASASVSINTSSFSVTASQITWDAAQATLTGLLSVAGDIRALTGSAALAMSRIRTLYNRHTHIGIASRGDDVSLPPRGGTL